MTGVDSGWFNGQPLNEAARAEVARRRDALTRAGVLVVDGELRDGSFVRTVLHDTKPERVAHLAGLSRMDLAASDGALVPNLVLTQTLLTALEGSALTRVMFASSSMVYGHFEHERAAETHPCRPMEPYGASKLAGEVLVQAWGRTHSVETVVVRPTAVYGVGDFNRRICTRFVDAALAGDDLVMLADGLERLDFTWIDDVAEGMALALTHPNAAGEVFNLSRGDARSVAELAAVVRAYVPSARVLAKSTATERPRRGTLVHDKAHRMLGFSPTVTLEEGVRRMLAARGATVPPKAIERVSQAPRVALSRPSITEREFDAVGRVLRSDWLTHGPDNERFEALLCKATGASHALTVNSCVSALVLALRAAGVTGEVIVPAFTFAATANAVALAGATPVFADIEAHTLGLDPEAVRAAITPRTEAIMAVHLAGMPCAIEALHAIAEAHNLALFEDAAQALGARVGNRAVGTFGRAGCYSFFPTKNITTGEGGALVSDDASLVAQARVLAGHGIARSTAQRSRSTHPWERRQVDIGWNFRMSALQAALGAVQLERLDAMNRARTRAARTLDAALAGTSLRRFTTPDDTHPVYAHYVARVPEDVARDSFVEALRTRGIDASVHYDRPVPYEAPWVALGHGGEGRYPVAEHIARTIVTLPMHPAIRDEELERIARAVREVLG